MFYENATQRYEEKVDQDLKWNNTFVHRLYNLNLGTKYTIMVSVFSKVYCFDKRSVEKRHKKIFNSLKVSIQSPYPDILIFRSRIRILS